MNRILVDTNIPMYAAGRDHPFKAAAQRALMAIAEAPEAFVTNAEVFQELLHRYLTGERPERAWRLLDSFQRLMSGRILAIDEDTLLQLARLEGLSPRPSARDLVHIACMRQHGIGRILSFDRDFDGLPGISRVDPADGGDM